jgi:hypothetical protein
MRSVYPSYLRPIVLNALLLAAAGPAFAGAHTWDVNEVFSNADGTIQFVELREAGGGAGETGVPGQTLSSDTQSVSPIGGGPLGGSTANKYFLIATAAFAALPGAPTPDAIIPAPSVPFFDTGGDTVDYGPYDSLAFASAPINGILSLNRDLTTGTNSPTNYAGATGSVNASGPAPLPALNEWGMLLVVAVLLLAGGAVVLRSRARAA